MNERLFLKTLKSIAIRLNDGKYNALSDLRRLDRQLYLIKIFKEWGSKDIKFLAFFTKQIVGIVWRNFAVDSPIDLSDLQLKELSENVGSQLLYLVDLLEENKIDKSYKALSSIVNTLYSDIIKCNDELYGVKKEG